MDFILFGDWLILDNLANKMAIFPYIQSHLNSWTQIQTSLNVLREKNILVSRLNTPTPLISKSNKCHVFFLETLWTWRWCWRELPLFCRAMTMLRPGGLDHRPEYLQTALHGPCQHWDKVGNHIHTKLSYFYYHTFAAFTAAPFITEK